MPLTQTEPLTPHPNGTHSYSAPVGSFTRRRGSIRSRHGRSLLQGITLPGSSSEGLGLPADAAPLLSPPLPTLARKAKQQPRKAALFPASGLGKGKAKKHAPETSDTRFLLPRSRKERESWRFRPLTAKQILAHKATTTPRRWIIEKLIPENALAEITAFMKWGKTTFVYELGMAIVRGKPFLDEFQTQQGRVLILCVEEDPRDAMLRLTQKLGLQEQDQIRLWPTTVKPWMLPEIREYVDRHRVKLVILDTLSKYWTDPDVGLQHENDNLGAGRAVTAFLDLARQNTCGCAVLLVHHDGIRSGKDGKSGRGATSPYGLVDQKFHLRLKHGLVSSLRRLEITGRYDVTPRELILDYVPNGLPPVKIDGVLMKPKHYVSCGTPDHTPVISDEDRVLAALKRKKASSVERVMQRAKLPRKPVDKALHQLLATGAVMNKRKGKRLVWWKTTKQATTAARHEQHGDEAEVKDIMVNRKARTQKAVVRRRKIRLAAKLAGSVLSVDAVERPARRRAQRPLRVARINES
jgi:AAA domain